jgi:hypothetical protein
MPDINEAGVIDNVDGEQSEEELQEEKAVKALESEYVQARKFDEDARKQYREDRGYASGNKLKNWASDANLIGTFIDILVSFLYAKNPEVNAKAAVNVGGVDPDAVDFAETAGIVVSRLWKKGRLKKAARKLVRSTLSVGPGWLKVIMTHKYKNDPVIQGKLNDLEDNVQRLELLQVQLQDESGDEDLDDDDTKLKLEELSRLRVSLNEKLEVIHRSGLAIDFVMADDMQVSLDVADLADHLDADWNGNEIYVRKDDLRRRFKRLTAKNIESAVMYNQVKPKKRTNDDAGYDGGSEQDGAKYLKSTDQGGDGDAVAFCRVIEVWDKRDNHIKTMVEGVKRWAVPPYQPTYGTSRFYPYFNLSLFEVDGARHPQSLSMRLKKLQDEYSSKRSNSRLAAERSIPGTIFDATGVKPADVTKIERSVSMEMIGINPMKGDDLRKLFAAKPIPTVDPLVFDTRPVVSDMERVSGVQEALSSTISVQKTATEAKIQDAGFNSRTGSDRDSLEDVLQDLAEYTLELAIQGMDSDQVTRIAGKSAFWPVDMDFEDIVTLAEIEIKAGSTGKPDEADLRNSWSILLPLVQAVMVQIQQAQVTGNVPMAVALRNLLQETFRRLDERIDVDQFIPAGELDNLQGVVEGILGDGGAPAPGGAGGPNNAADANTLV